MGQIISLNNELSQFASTTANITRERLDFILSIFSQSDLGQDFLNFVKKANIRIQFDAQMESKWGGQYYPGQGFVTLNPCYGNAQLVGILAHELRHCWQDFHKLDAKATSTPYKKTIYRRFQEADAYSFQLYFAHRHFEATGKDELITPLTSNKLYRGLVSAFQKNWSKNHDLIQARRAVFDAFFESGNPIKAEYDVEFFEFSKALDQKNTNETKEPSAELSSTFYLSHLKKFGLMGINITKDSPNYLTHDPLNNRKLDDHLYYSGFGLKHHFENNLRHIILKSPKISTTHKYSFRR